MTLLSKYTLPLSALILITMMFAIHKSNHIPNRTLNIYGFLSDAIPAIHDNEHIILVIISKVF